MNTTPVLKSASEISRMVSAAVKRYNGACEALHAAAWHTTVHALVDGDTTLLSRFLESLGKKQAAQDIAAWVRHFGAGENKAISAFIGKKGVSVKIGKEEDRPAFNRDEAWTTPYYTLFEGKETKTEFELDKAIHAFVKRVVSKAGDVPSETIKAKFNDALRAAKAA